MRIDILTLFPEIFDSLNSFSIIDKAIKSKKVNIELIISETMLITLDMLMIVLMVVGLE